MLTDAILTRGARADSRKPKQFNNQIILTLTPPGGGSVCSSFFPILTASCSYELQVGHQPIKGNERKKKEVTSFATRRDDSDAIV
jgi:hypothetical protein